MTIREDLEERLKKLEIEQENQDVALNHIGDLEKEIRQLEATLATIDNYLIDPKGQKSDYSELRDLESIEKLEQKLAHIDEEYEQKSGKSLEPVTKTAAKTSSSPAIVKEKTATSTSTGKATSSSTSNQAASYVICLMFDAKSPTEWSGNGWSEQGKGMRYSSLEQVKLTYQKLKQKWPDYPLKIYKK
jgi:hypothetical protein